MSFVKLRYLNYRQRFGAMAIVAETETKTSKFPLPKQKPILLIKYKKIINKMAFAEYFLKLQIIR